MGQTVLVVDDEADIRLTLGQILREEGLDVHEARNGLEALEKILAHDPDLVLLDLMMPVLDGWEVQRILRNARPSLPVIVLSAFATHESDDVIPKPVSFARLEQLLRTIRDRLAHEP